jgi:hypothetical protein
MPFHSTKHIPENFRLPEVGTPRHTTQTKTVEFPGAASPQFFKSAG